MKKPDCPRCESSFGVVILLMNDSGKKVIYRYFCFICGCKWERTVIEVGDEPLFV